MSFLDGLLTRAPTQRRIGFPEAAEARTSEAMRRLAGDSGPVPVAMADGNEVPAGIERLDLGEGDMLRLAVTALRDGLLDGVVAGAVATTADVVRAGLDILGTGAGRRTVSGAFYMVLPARDRDDEQVLTFADAAVVPRPDSSQLAEIAESACDARSAIVGDEPRVAFLSYSTLGSAEGAEVGTVRDAVAKFRRRRPDVTADGELQADAALSPEVAGRKAPGSPLAGSANVLVFPDLASANISYKLVQRLAGARAIGPILHGLSAPLNDLSRGASVEDIVHVACVTALQATG